MAATKMLFLDIDGVLVKDKSLLQNVRNNIIKYVHHRAPIKNLDTIQARHLNESLYKTYGHTLRGMRIAFPQNKDDFTNSDFAKNIYNTQLLNNLFKHINTSTEFKDLHSNFQSVLDKCRDQNISVHIFFKCTIFMVCTNFNCF
jgi:FMN phosphatase YigB (HAD superfamily)